MFKKLICLIYVLIILDYTNSEENPQIKLDNSKILNVTLTKVWGPGLKPDKIVHPARYFFIHGVDVNGNLLNTSLSKPYDIIITGRTKQNRICRVGYDQIDRKDGSIIVRYKLHDHCIDMQIHIKYKGEHIAQSPYRIDNIVYGDECFCPARQLSVDQWLMDNECSKEIDQQIIDDLIPFPIVNYTNIRSKLIDKFNHPESTSFCNYIIRTNRIYRKCYGKYTGFKMFMDSILLSLSRKLILPDVEFFINLGDWPLIKKYGLARTTGPYPMFSWCGSNETFDIVLPTYDITESTLENMNRVSLDMLSVQRVSKTWTEKNDQAFWRGRDSRRERLDLIALAKEHPDLFNVSITHFFFYRDQIDLYGPPVQHISFMEFFDYKYQISIDGTVAAYRLPYLLGGNSVVLKQESHFYEHFYKKLIPMKHFIPFKRDLSDLKDKIEYARSHESEVLKIIEESNTFINENLLPQHIFCYHVQLLKEWSKRIVSDIMIIDDMEYVPNDKIKTCSCDVESHDEL